ncbi:hypothetical protein ICM05_05290 [Leucobacter sp. cx-42]|uniref:hypothetical protein n=1 Tax=unclassified Leucobacter TaxID=2621730 RepID=UPI00165E1537|nr:MULTISPECIES: hypothetical protein [unclassified Leucobacter]MBC9954060.1 hypothetical protein [Leucobacter sp. cx-42]
MPNPTLTSDNSLITSSTPPKVIINIRRIKTEVEAFFAERGFILSGVRTWYNSETAVRSSESFRNSGKPVAYLRFADALLTAPSQPNSPRSVTLEEIAEALAHVRETLSDLPEITIMEGSRTLKVVTETWFSESEIRTRRRNKGIPTE